MAASGILEWNLAIKAMLSMAQRFDRRGMSGETNAVLKSFDWLANHKSKSASSTNNLIATLPLMITPLQE